MKRECDIHRSKFLVCLYADHLCTRQESVIAELRSRQFDGLPIDGSFEWVAGRLSTEGCHSDQMSHRGTPMRTILNNGNDTLQHQQPNERTSDLSGNSHSPKVVPTIPYAERSVSSASN